ncbi:MAG: hypothetical protein QXR02_01565 [Acidilobaceae archaeon]
MVTDNLRFEWLQSLLLLIILGALLLLLLRQTMELSRIRGYTGKITKVFTIEACGDKIEKREFREGDYVGLVTGECGEGLQKRIIGIYSEEVQESKSG